MTRTLHLCHETGAPLGRLTISSPMNPPKPIVAITGSSGLIGSALVKRLATNFHVIGFDRAGPPHPPPEAECINLDLGSDQSVVESFARVKEKHGTRLASVIHLAAYYSFSDKFSPKYDEITVRGTERLLRALGDFQVDQFIFSSTMLVHEPARFGHRINETTRFSPRWGYPESKVKTENLIDRMRGSMPTVIMRIAGVYDDACHSIPIAHQIQRIYERQFTSHLFPGNKQHGQSFIHLDDLIDLTALVVDRRKELPQKFTILAGEEDVMSYEDLQNNIGTMLHGEPWWTLRIPKWFAKFGAWLQQLTGLGDKFIKPWLIDFADDHYPLDMGRVKSYLGWAPRHSLRNTLSKMITYLKSNPRQWYSENNLEPPAHLPAALPRQSAPHADPRITVHR
jgi:nucleoside-diphosphate-sugar epimerase